MPDGSQVVITGGSLELDFSRDHFTENGNKFTHKDKITLVSLSINGGAPITLNKRDVITIRYEVKS